MRTISQVIGYTSRTHKQIRVYNLSEMVTALRRLGLTTEHLVDTNGHASSKAQLLNDYFEYRAEVLNQFVEPRLMDANRAKAVFENLRASITSSRTFSMNKQKGEKRNVAYLTGIVNLLIEANIGEMLCDYDPRTLTTFTQNGIPLRTLARRVDGCFPSTVNPIAVWEIKEYYYTTTFGSRVADGVYETLLDGLELEELREHEGVDAKHLLIVDAYDTWWLQGRSYLCRLIDILHMGYVDEILFGYEVVERLPSIVQEWVKIAKMS
ncbi:MAG: hypothetical protein ABI835_07630 [Chloroflexota bacterium]